MYKQILGLYGFLDGDYTGAQKKRAEIYMQLSKTFGEQTRKQVDAVLKNGQAIFKNIGSPFFNTGFYNLDKKGQEHISNEKETADVLKQRRKEDQNKKLFLSNTVDPNNLKYICYGYSEDGNRLIYQKGNKVKIIEGVDKCGFKLLHKDEYGNVYLSNGNTVVFEGNIIEGMDGKEFKYIGGGYSRNTSKVFFNGKIIEGILAEDFKYIDKGWGKAGNIIINKGEIHYESSIN